MESANDAGREAADYGQTPDEAARQLAQWLALAHGRQTAHTTQPS